jgi:undecaprenyl-diphosphatase
MATLQSLILGIVQGITEFLPISSTGHLILTSELLKISQSDFVKSFEIVIQLGSVLSVVVLYWKSFLDVENLKKLIIGFLPAGVVGFAFYKVVKSYLIGNQYVVLWSLFIGGMALIIFEFWHKESESAAEGIARISYKQSFAVGMCQAVAIIPGVSRSAATIVGGLLAGLKRKTIVEFSFMLAVPTMLAASVFDFVRSAPSFSNSQLGVLAVGFAVSFVVAAASIKFFLNFIKKHSFIPFGAYRILLALVFWLIILK